MPGLQSQPTKSSNPLVVLHIEDNAADARLAELALARADGEYRSLNAQTLDEGVRMVKNEDVDVVLLDLGLPGIVGTEGLDAVNSASPQTPIVVLTGDSTPGRAAEAPAALADDFLPKSDIDSTTLARAVRHSIERRRLALQVREQAAELEANEARLRTILETITDGILVVDLEERVLYANPAARTLYGRATDDGTNWRVAASDMDTGAVIQI